VASTRNVIMITLNVIRSGTLITFHRVHAAVELRHEHEAELDFIIYYDIKYRMGKQTSEVLETSEV